MIYYSIKVTVMLKRNLNNIEAYEKIFNLLSRAMLEDTELSEFHEANLQKLYTFCSLYPLEKDGIYKSGRMYVFDIRTIRFNLALKLKNVLQRVETEYFKIITLGVETNKQRKINKLTTLTPAIITMPKGDYDIGGDILLVKKRMLDGIQKKYFTLTGKKTDVDFIETINQINRVPIKIPYKNIHFLGNKFEIIVNEDDVSQDLAYIALATGILEKNSIGFGFCKAK